MTVTTTKKSTTKASRKRAPDASIDEAPPSDGAPEKMLARLREMEQALFRNELSIGSAVREAPTDEEADAAVEEEADSPLAAAVLRAMRFADKEGARVRLLPNLVECCGHRGSVMVPWHVPSLPASGLVVDGKKFYRCLRAAGPEAQLVSTGDGSRLDVKFGSRRFSLACFSEDSFLSLRPEPNATYAFARPSVVSLASCFAGTESIAPIELSGVHLEGGAAIASDRRAGVVVFGAVDDPKIKVTVPRNAFDGLSVGPDGDDRVAFGLTKQGHAVIADPRTGEWRVLVSYDLDFPDVRGILSRMDAKFFVDVNKDEFVSVLKQFRLVQTPASGVKIHVWSAPPTSEEGAGDWMEMSGGDPSNECDFVARLGVSIQRTTPSGESGASGVYRVCIALDELLNVAQCANGSVVRLGFGDDDRSPLVVKNDLYEICVMPIRW